MEKARMRARVAALVSSTGEVVDLWRHKPEADHTYLRRKADTIYPDAAPHQWVIMAPTGEYA